MRYTIDLPFPISANRLWRRGGTRIHKSAEYKLWLDLADRLWMTRKPPGRPAMLGAYTIAVTLDQTRRHGNADGDNLLKCINDWLQRVELVHDDKLCEQWSGTWGRAAEGCRVEIAGEPYVSSCSGTGDSSVPHRPRYARGFE